jgi:hypothetical protein
LQVKEAYKRKSTVYILQSKKVRFNEKNGEHFRLHEEGNFLQKWEKLTKNGKIFLQKIPECKTNSPIFTLNFLTNFQIFFRVTTRTT